MKKHFPNKGMIAAVTLAMFVNAAAVPAATAYAATGYLLTTQKDYDPFLDDEAEAAKAEQEKAAAKRELTFKERLAAKQTEAEKQQAQAQNRVLVDDVLPGHIYIPKGTKLKMELVSEASSKKLKKNQLVDIRMVDNLIINGVVVIPKGTLGTGYVYEAQKAGGFGRKGVLRIAANEIKTLNNVSVPLKLGLQGKGNTDGGAVAVAAAVSLVGGLFMKGSNITYPAGTDFEVAVRQNVDLGVTQAQLAEAMNPDVPHGIELKIGQ